MKRRVFWSGNPKIVLVEMCSPKVANVVGLNETAEKLPFEVLEKFLSARLDIGAEVRSLKGNVKKCLVVQGGEFAKKRGGGGVGREGWDNEGCWRVPIHRVRRGGFADDAGKSGVQQALEAPERRGRSWCAWVGTGGGEQLAAEAAGRDG